MARVVGVDIGTSAVRAAELEIGEGRSQLVTFMQVALTPGAVVDGEVRDVSSVADALKRLFDVGGFSTKSVTIGLAGVRAITRDIEIPYVPDDEVESVVKFQAQEVLPFPSDQLVMQSQTISDFTGADGGMMRKVQVVAAHKEVVMPVAEAAERAGLDLVAVDLVPLALIRALCDISYAIEQPEALLSVGAGITVLVVHQKGRPQFVRMVGIGGNTASMSIAGTMDMPFSDAETLKKRIGFDESPQVQAATKAVDSAIKELVDEVRNSLRFYSSLPGGGQVARLLVTGGGSRLKGFLPKLQEEAGVPVYPVSPLAKLDMSKVEATPDQIAEMDAVISTSVGLVEPDVFPGARRFNLVPAEVRERAFQKKVQTWSVAAGIVLLLLIAGWSFFSWWQVHNVNGSISSLNAQVATLNAELPKYSKPAAAVRELTTAKSIVSSEVKQAVYWGEVMTALDRATPSGFSITAATGAGACVTGIAGASSSSTSCSFSSVSGTGSTGGIGTITLTLEGIASNFNPAAAWISRVSALSLTGHPNGLLFGAITSSQVVTSGGTQTFTSTVVVMPPSSLLNDPTYG
ncbi:MAG: type IV pilus assembly protein PilM [Acidimicrobiales bacterium]